MKHRTVLEQESMAAEARPEVIALLERSLAYWTPAESMVIQAPGDVQPILNVAERRWLIDHGFQAAAMGADGLKIVPYQKPAPEPPPRVDPPVPFWSKFLRGMFWMGIVAIVIGGLWMTR